MQIPKARVKRKIARLSCDIRSHKELRSTLHPQLQRTLNQTIEKKRFAIEMLEGLLK